MIFTGSSDWGGAFRNPIMKHRDYCGDITNHFDIKSATMLDNDEIEEHDEDIESDLLIDELDQIGDGSIAWLVTIGFIEDDSREYEFVVYADERDEVKEILAERLRHP